MKQPKSDQPLATTAALAVCLLLRAPFASAFVFSSCKAPMSLVAGLPAVSRPQTALQAQPRWLNSVSSLTRPKVDVREDAQRLKEQIDRISRGLENGVKANEEERQAVLDLAAQLNKFNQVKNIATSSKVDGLWRLVFTTTKGASAGRLGPFIGEVDQFIDTSQGKYINYVRLAGGAVEGSLEAAYEVKGSNKWKVIFKDITFKLLGLPVVDKKDLGGQAGIWRLTYVDEDLRILYACGLTKDGKPARAENLYILRKVNRGKDT